MISLRTLGAIDLTGDDGREYDGLLRQPKRLALLIYLASPQPGVWHRRETLLGVFWPEFEAGKARTALRNALYVIRQELGPDILRTRGDDEVAVDPAKLQSDAATFEAACASGNNADAVEHYHGDFLPGFFVSDAAEFEHWLDDERHRLRTLAAKAITARGKMLEADGDLSAALVLQRRLVATVPDDESAVRRLIVLLDRSGDRGLALEEFERLQARLRSVFDTQPSAETVALVHEIRARRAPAAPAAPSRAETPAAVMHEAAEVPPSLGGSS